MVFRVNVTPDSALSNYSWLYSTDRSFGIPGIEPGSATYKANALPLCY